MQIANLHAGSQSSGRPLGAPYWPPSRTHCFAVSPQPGKDIWRPEPDQQGAQCAPPAASSHPSLLQQVKLHVLFQTGWKNTNLSPPSDPPWCVECVVSEEDNDLAGTSATRSINTGHLLDVLPSRDLAASFWHMLGTAVRKGQHRITESMCDRLDLKEQDNSQVTSQGP